MFNDDGQSRSRKWIMWVSQGRLCHVTTEWRHLGWFYVGECSTVLTESPNNTQYHETQKMGHVDRWESHCLDGDLHSSGLSPLAPSRTCVFAYRPHEIKWVLEHNRPIYRVNFESLLFEIMDLCRNLRVSPEKLEHPDSTEQNNLMWFYVHLEVIWLAEYILTLEVSDHHKNTNRYNRAESIACHRPYVALFRMGN